MAIYSGLVPPAQNCQRVDPKCGLNVVAGRTLAARIDLAVSTAYALSGGQAAAVVLSRFKE